MNATTNRALDMADSFLGPGSREIAPGVFRSADGLRQVRMTASDLAPRPDHFGGSPHLNFETGSISMNNGRATFEVSTNMHVVITD